MRTRLLYEEGSGSDGIKKFQQLQKRGEKLKKIAVLLAILFVAPMVSLPQDRNLALSEKYNSGKSVDADVAVIDLNVTTNSVYVGATPTLSPISHTIKVDILNLGGSTGEGNLTLEVNTGSGFTEVDRRIISINAAQQESHLLYWDASLLSGSGFSLKATWEVNLTISTDSDMTNDILTMQGISVSSVENAISISDSLPYEGASLARAQWVGEITVVNTGNEPVNISAQLSLTSTSSGEQIQIQSSTVNNLPGSLANPTQPENISLTFDATSLEGTYTLSGNLLVIGPSGNPLTTTIESRTISFVALRATLISANNRNIDPGGQTILNFILQNSGDEGDNFTVTQSNSTVGPIEWVQSPGVIYSGLSPLEVNSGQAVAIQIPVTVPLTAAISESVTVTITVVSQAANYRLTASSTVMAGALYQAEISQNHSHDNGPTFANITPGEPRTIDYTLLNSGTAPAQFDIYVSPTESVPAWEINSPVKRTDLIMPNETRTIPVTISTPTLKMPLDPTWKISADTQVQLGIQAIPLEGGLPATNTTTIIVSPMVEIEVEITGEPEDVQVEQFLDGTKGFSNTDRYVDFEVRLLHNLGSNNNQATVNLEPNTATGYTNGKKFTPIIPNPNSRELERYYATITPEIMSLQPGQTGYGVISITHQHKNSIEFPYPAAGTFSFGFTAASDWGSFAGTVSKNDSAETSYSVEKLRGAFLNSTQDVAYGDPNTLITSTMTLKNLGNSPDDFQISVFPLDQLEEPLIDWTVTVNKPAVNQLKSRTDLYDFTSEEDNSDTVQFTISATPPSTASADTYHEVWIVVNSTATGERLHEAAAYFKLNEQVSAELNPSNITYTLDRLGQSTLILTLNNSGNSNKTFQLDLDNKNDDRIQASFSEDSDDVLLTKQMEVASGAQAIVRIYALAGTSARADDVNKLEVSVSDPLNGTEYARSGINIQVNPFHFLNFQMSPSYTAIPGQTLTIPVNIVNNGNLMETLNLSACMTCESLIQNPEKWNQTANRSEVQIEPMTSEEIEISISIPMLEPGSVIGAYELFTIPIQALNITENIIVGTSDITIEILPVFALNVIEAPGRIAVLPQEKRTVEFQLENVGNAPVSIAYSHDITAAEDNRFSSQVTSEGSTTLQVGEILTLSVSITPIASQHFKGESAILSIVFTPLGQAELDPIEMTTPIEVVRVQTDEEIVLDPDGPILDQGQTSCGDGCVSIVIPWQHVPSLEYGTGINDVEYNLSVVGIPTRLVNYVIYPETQWSFDINDKCTMLSSSDSPGIGATTSEDGEVSPCSTGFEVGLVQEFEGDNIILDILLPDKKNLASGDGWDITLRLKNEAEESSPNPSIFWTDFTVKLRMKISSDPLIENIEFNGPAIEGNTANLTVKIINAGNAIMPTGTKVIIQCDGGYASLVSGNSKVTSAEYILPSLGPSENLTAHWNVEVSSLPWWSSKEDFTCHAALSGTISTILGNNASNDNLSAKLTLSSWAPPTVNLEEYGIPLPISIPSIILLTFILLLVTLAFLRRGFEDQPNYLHLSAYFGSATLGTVCLASTSNVIPPLAAILAITYTSFIAYISSSELQTIHDDRKKARIGTRAVLDNHDNEQINTRNELRAIISCSSYVLLPFVLIDPTLTISMEGLNIALILLYLASSPILVHFILGTLDRSYDRLYGELAEIELRAIKIKKILGTVGKRD